MDALQLERYACPVMLLIEAGDFDHIPLHSLYNVPYTIYRPYNISSPPKALRIARTKSHAFVATVVSCGELFLTVLDLLPDFERYSRVEALC